MTYHDQPYYKEFRDLLTRIQSGVNDLKEENQRLKEENNAFSNQLKEIRGQLAEASRTVERLRSEQASSTRAVENDAVSGASAAGKSGSHSPGLFNSLDENEKRILRQQIIDLIARVDKHLGRSGASVSPDR